MFRKTKRSKLDIQNRLMFPSEINMSLNKKCLQKDNQKPYIEADRQCNGQKKKREDTE